ncbi:MAG: C-GCAxxG-C-C family protein [Anaerolineaceae bacterium]|nr:C-GCAxxG-C-C family protein [Anaerolineaceae bacterium]
MNLSKIKINADEKMQAGCNCCEAVYWSFLESNGNHDLPEEDYKIASIFGGGIANSHDEICGALTGALFILSTQKGRLSCAENNDALMENGARLREDFIKKIGPTKCSLLRKKIEKPDGEINCREVVQKTIDLLSMIEIKA